MATRACVRLLLRQHCAEARQRSALQGSLCATAAHSAVACLLHSAEGHSSAWHSKIEEAHSLTT